MTRLYRGPSSRSYVSRVTPPYRVHRVTIVGESPDSRGRECYDTPLGKRILELMGEEVPWHNIHGAKPPRWSDRVARARSADWMSQNPLETEPFLLLGRRVCKAFGVPRDAEWLEWYVTPEHRHSMIVFPGNTGSWWSLQDNREAARTLLQGLVRGDLPHQEKNMEKKS